MAARPTLAALANRLGILPRYVDTSGTTHETSDRTYEALVAALGFRPAPYEALATAGVMAMLPTALFSPIAGVVADRLSRRAIIDRVEQALDDRRAGTVALFFVDLMAALPQSTRRFGLVVVPGEK